MNRILKAVYTASRNLAKRFTETRGEATLPPMFSKYPDVVGIDQLREMLGGISKNKAYELVRTGLIKPLPYIKTYKIPKVNVIKFIENK